MGWKDGRFLRDERLALFSGGTLWILPISTMLDMNITLEYCTA